MFFTLCILSGLAYGLQGSLMVSVYRRLEAIHGVALRGLSLGLTMLPLVLLSSDVYKDWTPILPVICIAALCSSIANFLYASAFRHINAGTVSTLSVSMATVVVSVLSMVMLRESLTAPQLGCMALLVFANCCLTTGKGQTNRFTSKDPLRGIVYATGSGIFGGVGAGLVGIGSRHGLPFAAGYLWESFIGITAVGIAWASRHPRSKPESISPRDFLTVLLCSSGTVIGTGAFAYASTIGSLGVAGGISLSLAMIFIALFSAVWYSEHLRPLQWLAVAMAALAIIMMKLLGAS